MRGKCILSFAGAVLLTAAPVQARQQLDELIAKNIKARGGLERLVRRKIVATREGGAITGEERLRERMADLYGVLVSYEGRPAEYQLEAVDVLARELKDVTAEMNALTAKTLPEINKLAAGKQLKPIAILSREAWEK